MKQIIYIATAISKQIEVWKLNSNWSLTLIQKINLYGEPQPILISYKKKCLYVSIRPNFSIDSYKIQSDGTLKKYFHTLLPSSVNHLELDQKEDFVFLSSYHFNCIHVCPINLYGAALPVIQTINNIYGCHASKVHYENENKHLFVSALKADRIYIYCINKNGYLSKNTCKFISVKKLSGPRHLDIQKNNNRLFSINELNGTVDIWNINRKILTEVKLLKRINILPVNFSKKSWSSDLHLSPCEKYLYVSDRNANMITTIKLYNHVNDIKTINFTSTELRPRSFSINSIGDTLIVLGEKSNSMSIYSISKTTGLLTFKNQYKIGLRPIWISQYLM